MTNKNKSAKRVVNIQLPIELHKTIKRNSIELNMPMYILLVNLLKKAVSENEYA